MYEKVFWRRKKGLCHLPRPESNRIPLTIIGIFSFWRAAKPPKGFGGLPSGDPAIFSLYERHKSGALRFSGSTSYYRAPYTSSSPVLLEWITRSSSRQFLDWRLSTPLEDSKFGALYWDWWASGADPVRVGLGPGGGSWMAVGSQVDDGNPPDLLFDYTEFTATKLCNRFFFF